MAYRTKSLEDELEALKARVKALEELHSYALGTSDGRDSFHDHPDASDEEDGVPPEPEQESLHIRIDESHYTTNDFQYGLERCPFCDAKFNKPWSFRRTNVGKRVEIKDVRLWNEMKALGISDIFQRRCSECHVVWYIHKK